MFERSLNRVTNLLNKKHIKRYKALAVSVFRFLVLISIGYIVIYPLMYLISTAFRSGESFYDPTITWITSKVTLSNFSYAINALQYPKAFANTIYYEIVSAFLQTISCAVVAYGLARFEFYEKKFLVGLLLITIFLPLQVTILPSYVNYAHMDIFGIFGKIYSLTGYDYRLNLLNTPFVFYLPSLLGVGLRSSIIIFIYMQFFKGLPKELEEAAWIDGCGPIRAFIRIAIPSSSVVIFTNLIFLLIWHWNDYFLAGMFLKDRDHFTLAVAMGEIQHALESVNIRWEASSPAIASIIMAGCLLYVMPMLIVYLFLQKKFVKSIDRVGITG